MPVTFPETIRSNCHEGSFTCCINFCCYIKFELPGEKRLIGIDNCYYSGI